MSSVIYMSSVTKFLFVSSRSHLLAFLSTLQKVMMDAFQWIHCDHIFSEFSLVSTFIRIVYFFYMSPIHHHPCQTTITPTCSIMEQEPIDLFSWATIVPQKPCTRFVLTLQKQVILMVLPLSHVTLLLLEDSHINQSFLQSWFPLSHLNSMSCSCWRKGWSIRFLASRHCNSLLAETTTEESDSNKNQDNINISIFQATNGAEDVANIRS